MILNAETISLIISLSAFAASITFFFAARKSETHTIELLSQISNQTDTLQSINDNLLGNAIHHLATSNLQISLAAAQLYAATNPHSTILNPKALKKYIGMVAESL